MDKTANFFFKRGKIKKDNERYRNDRKITLKLRSNQRGKNNE